MKLGRCRRAIEDVVPGVAGKGVRANIARDIDGGSARERYGDNASIQR